MLVRHKSDPKKTRDIEGKDLEIATRHGDWIPVQPAKPLKEKAQRLAETEEAPETPATEETKKPPAKK